MLLAKGRRGKGAKVKVASRSKTIEKLFRIVYYGRS